MQTGVFVVSKIFVVHPAVFFFGYVYLRAWNPAIFSKVQQTMKTASSDEELAFKQKVLWMQVGRAKKKHGSGGFNYPPGD